MVLHFCPAHARQAPQFCLKQPMRRGRVVGFSSPAGASVVRDFKSCSCAFNGCFSLTRSAVLSACLLPVISLPQLQHPFSTDPFPQRPPQHKIVSAGIARQTPCEPFWKQFDQLTHPKPAMPSPRVRVELLLQRKRKHVIQRTSKSYQIGKMGGPCSAFR